MAMIVTQANNRRGFVSRGEAGALSAAALLLHGALFWLVFHQSPVTSVYIPQMASASAENVVMVDLTAPPEAPAPAPVQPETVPQPDPAPTPPVATVDEDAIAPKPEKKEVVKKTESEPKRKPPAKTEHKARPATQAALSAAPSRQSQGSTADTASTAGAPAANSAGPSITPAVSGMQSLGNPPPDYPPLALRRQQQGSVTLRILVLENGHADSVTVIKSSQSELLDNAAVKTVGLWRFIPAKRGNQAIKGYAIQTITFTLPR